MPRRRAFQATLLGLILALGSVIVPATPAAALDVYTTPGTHTLNGRQWRTTCEDYSSTVERCRTEIQATVISLSSGSYSQRTDWAFNNLTYKPSPRGPWAGNLLATPGEHTSGGRRWKTECDTQWTGMGACRSSIWTTTHSRAGGKYVTTQQWVFNNIVRFSDSGVSKEVCVPAEKRAAVGALRFADPEATASSAPSAETAPISETVEPDAVEPEATDPQAAEPEATEPEATEPETTEAAVLEPQAMGPALSEPEAADPEVTQPDSTGPNVEDAVEPEAVKPAAKVEPKAAVEPQAAATVRISSIQHAEYPVGVLYDRLGSIEVKGNVSGGRDGATVDLQLLDAAGQARTSATAILSKGVFTGYLPGGFDGKATVVVKAAGAQATNAVTLRKATATAAAPAEIDPLGGAPITGKVTPAIGDLMVSAHVAVPGGWLKTSEARTTADGSYSLTYHHGKGQLGSSEVRICVTLPWGSTIPGATALQIERSRIANPVITNTTAAEVAHTYRSGCPIGPTGLSTIRINQQSMDGSVYRGEIVVRRARAAEVAAVFTETFEAGFPVYQMTNPNVFGGNDIAMMAANNTSAFNCRRVVGNPYAMSPHSYGYAVDINPWQNPYRDPSGKWHPSTAHVKRTPVVPGMLTSSSAPVKAFQARGWRWFSGWDWHHFEKR